LFNDFLRRNWNRWNAVFHGDHSIWREVDDRLFLIINLRSVYSFFCVKVT